MTNPLKLINILQTNARHIQIDWGRRFTGIDVCLCWVWPNIISKRQNFELVITDDEWILTLRVKLVIY
jgi:hypothetical protein